MKEYFSKQLLNYEHVYHTKQPTDRVSIIKAVSKNTLLILLSRINFNLESKSGDKLCEDLETQQKMFDTFFGLSPATRSLFVIPWSRLSNETEENAKITCNWLLFTRETCLFAIEEIINSDCLQNIDNYTLKLEDDRKAILDYILAVNYTLFSAQVEQDESYQKTIKSYTPGSIAYDLNTLEYVNSKMLAINELTIGVNPVNTFYRGYNLMEYLLEHSEYKDKVKAYFRDIYDVEPIEFLFYVLELYIGYERVDIRLGAFTDISFDYFNLYNRKYEEFIDTLSRRIKNKNTYKMLSIRKSPFIKINSKRYVLTDKTFLIEKCYDQFINDFIFDKLKKEEGNKSTEDTTEIISFKSAVGRFVERYLDQLLKRAFVNYKHCVLKTLEDLQTERRDAEVADFYLRYNKKILIGEVKSGSIYDKAKFGGNPTLLYKDNPDKFFDYFGLNKMVGRIKNLEEKFLPFDTKLPVGHTLTVYPCIVVNDKVFQTFFWADIFNKRFQKLLEETDRRKLNIRPLRLMHVSDFEKIETHLTNNPNAIWNLLSYNRGENKFIFPFDFTSIKYYYKNNIKFNSSSISEDLFRDLYSKYKPRPAE